MKTGKHSIVKPRNTGRVASTVGFALAGTALASLSTMQVFGIDPQALAESTGGSEDGTGAQAADNASVSSALAYSQADNASEKSETVYVFTEANGSVRNIEVASELKNADGAATLRDQSTLTGIENTEGDEEYSENADGLVWDAQGKDIYYKGTSDAEAPVGIKVAYWLDGHRIDPSELADKSGKVKIRYEYENRLRQTRDVGGRAADIYTPFLCITGLVLDNDTFKNVEVDGGKAIDDGDRTIAAGLALPGLAESLDLGADIDVDIPDSFEITADVTDFSLSNALTMVTSDLFSDVDTGKLDTGKIEDALGALQDGIDQLIDGSRSLMKGLNKLSDGTGKLKSKTAALPEQTRQLNAGAQQLASGLGKLDTGADSLAGNLGTLKGALKGASSGAGSIESGLDAATKSGGSIDQLIAGVTSVSTAAGQAASFATQAQEGIAKVDGSSISGVAAELGAIARALASSSDSTAQEQAAKLQEQIQKLYNASDAVDSIAEYAGAAAKYAKGAQDATSSSGDLRGGLNALKSGLSGAQDGAGQIATSLGAATADGGSMDQLAGGAEQLASGARSASSGAGQLASGTSRLAQATPTLVAGIEKLDSGALAAYKGSQQLVDGLKRYNEEGIQKLIDAYNDNVAGLGKRLDAVKAAGDEYQNFSGKAKGTKGSVKFVYETDAIETGE